MATALDVRRIALSLPETSEGTSYGTPSFKVAKTLFARLWDDYETLAMKMDFAEREALIAEEPERFFLTDHYRNYPFVLVRLPEVSVERLEELLAGAWRFCAPKKLQAAHPGR